MLRLLGGLLAFSALGRGSTPEADEDFERERLLLRWGDQRREPVEETQDPVAGRLLDHAREERALALFYHGGRQPGCMRRFSPRSVFRHRRGDRLYVSGFCHLRQAPRVLRIDRISLA